MGHWTGCSAPCVQLWELHRFKLRKLLSNFYVNISTFFHQLIVNSLNFQNFWHQIRGHSDKPEVAADTWNKDSSGIMKRLSATVNIIFSDKTICSPSPGTRQCGFLISGLGRRSNRQSQTSLQILLQVSTFVHVPTCPNLVTTTQSEAAGAGECVPMAGALMHSSLANRRKVLPRT